MNWAHSRAAQSRSSSVRDSQSARSREKSMSAGFQNFALPPAKSFIGRLSQLSPPASSERECVRVIGFSSSNDVGASQSVRSTRTDQDQMLEYLVGLPKST